MGVFYSYLLICLSLGNGTRYTDGPFLKRFFSQKQLFHVNILIDIVDVLKDAVNVLKDVINVLKDVINVLKDVINVPKDVVNVPFLK